MLNKKITTAPGAVFSEYKQGNEYKASIGKHGIYEQSAMNERFSVGDQWYGVNCGNDRPLVRRNIIKRIGEQKLSSIGASPVAVNYSADGVPDNASIEEEKKQTKEIILAGGDFVDEVEPAEISFITDAMSDYFRITAERVKFESKKEQALRSCYISGTTVAYTYWDSSIKTGLYADENKTTAINGDINFEILDIENVVFGDPNCEDVERQPYIIISQRIDVNEVRREATRNNISKEEIDKIKPDGVDYLDINAGTRGEQEPTDSKRITVLTKFWKQWDKRAEDYTVMCERVTEKAVVRRPFDIGIKLYPFAKMCWQPRYSCAYGDSEITYMIPNQIAINRALSAAVWNLMKTGMPITVVNGDIVTEPVTNTPGQILKVYGDAQDTARAIHHVEPPAFSNQFVNFVNDLANNSLSDAGANDAALGNLRPDNAAAILQVREAALQPMQIYQNRFYSFVEDIARIWAEFWIRLYGDRQIKYEDKDGVYYIPFHASRYENLLLTAKIDVGSSPIWDISSTMAMLDNMLRSEVITKLQYLERIPQGIIPDLSGLIKDAREELQAMNAPQGDVMSILQQQYPEIYAQFESLTPEEQQTVLANIGLGGQGAAPMPEIGDI